MLVYWNVHPDWLRPTNTYIGSTEQFDDRLDGPVPHICRIKDWWNFGSRDIKIQAVWFHVHFSGPFGDIALSLLLLCSFSHSCGHASPFVKAYEAELKPPRLCPVSDHSNKTWRSRWFNVTFSSQYGGNLAFERVPRRTLWITRIWFSFFEFVCCLLSVSMNLFKQTCISILGGGFRYFVFLPLPGEMIQFD